jgi:HD superfamily phosphohydrolase
MIFLEKAKIYRDVIHDTITTTKIANCIINTKYFQRLRYLHQLGVCYYIFPNANNTRFEHSIGTYHLAQKYLNNIIQNSEPKVINKTILEIPFIRNYALTNLNLEDTPDNIKFLQNLKSHIIDDYLIELIKIAGLCHDIGHGPFSHLFDEWLYSKKELQNLDFIEHENRSIIILKKIIETSTIIENDEIYKISEFINHDAYNFISELICPNVETSNNFIFQIISNSLNGLDVDKLDYLCRDSFYLGLNTPFQLSRIIDHAKVVDNNICFPEKVSYDIYKIYRTRYDLHKQFYNHKTVILIEYMIRSIMDKLDNFLKMIDIIKNNDIDGFIDLVDSSIFNTTSIIKQLKILNIYKHLSKDIDEINFVIDNINTRSLYKCICQKTFPPDQEINIDKLMEENSQNIDKKYLIPVIIKIGFLSGNKSHPFDNIYFYDKNNFSKILTKNNENINHYGEISYLMSHIYQEKLFFIISRI